MDSDKYKSSVRKESCAGCFVALTYPAQNHTHQSNAPNGWHFVDDREPFEQR